MSVKKSSDGWQVDIRPAGHAGKRYRKKVPTKSEALAYEKWVLSQYHNKDWLDKPKDTRLLSELVSVWAGHVVNTVKRPEEQIKRVNQLVSLLGNPRVDLINTRFIAEFRAKRLESIKATTFNRDLSVLSNVFTLLIENGLYSHENPFKGQKAKQLPTKLIFLSKDQIRLLLNSLDAETLLFTKLCLQTGARFGEAQQLRTIDIQSGRVIFPDTKTGKPRTVPISSELESELLKHANGRSNVFDITYLQFNYRLRKIIDLPKGQSSHVLRHTFASHYIMNGGSLVVLQKILGHSKIDMTMRYAHLSPDYLADILNRNPLAMIDK